MAETTVFWLLNLKNMGQFEDLGLSGRTKLGEGLAEIGLESSCWVNLAHNIKLAGSCEFGNESLHFIKCREFFK